MFTRFLNNERKRSGRRRRAPGREYEDARRALHPDGQGDGSDDAASPDAFAADEPPSNGAARSSGDIWDQQGVSDAPHDGSDTAPASQGRAVRRGSRTRLIGFDTSDGGLADPFAEATNRQSTALAIRFPAAWLVVIDGPGRGHAFVLTNGMAQIGRGDDQAVQLDFGDDAISRNNHAAVVYDPETRTFMLGHGGKANIVRLNGRPLVSSEEMDDGDEITIGETTLVLRTFCGPDFDWLAQDRKPHRDADGGDDGDDGVGAEEDPDDVAIT